MKFIIALLILSAQLFALTIVLNSGKESKINYAILHLIDTQPLKCSFYLFLHHPNETLINKVKETFNINMLKTSNYNEFLKKKSEWWLGWENIPFDFDEVSNKIIEINKILQKVETVWRNEEAQKA